MDGGYGEAGGHKCSQRHVQDFVQLAGFIMAAIGSTSVILRSTILNPAARSSMHSL